MSSLLQNVLASRLAQATLGDDETGSSSADATSASTSRTMPPPGSTSSSGTAPSAQGLEDWERVDSTDASSDDEFVGE